MANQQKSEFDERIVMTPTKKGRGHTTIRMERIRQTELDKSSVMHIAGGDHKGIIINKEATPVNGDTSPSQLSLEFKVFLTNAANNLHTQESRQLRFWFRPEISEAEQMHSVQDFFKELVSPNEFPRDYVGFIKKIMKLMQLSYTQIRKIEVEMRQLDESFQAPSRPTLPNVVTICLEAERLLPPPAQFSSSILKPPSQNNRKTKNEVFRLKASAFASSSVASPPLNIKKKVSMDDSFVDSRNQLTPEKVLELIESAYPNPLHIEAIAKSCSSAEEDVHFHLCELEAKGLIKSMESGTYTRVTQNDTEVKLVRQMPLVNRSQQPTIAIITAQYCEKLAVDAMIDNKDTYVRYKTEGESNVYTLGNIGAHRVVSTKLPAVGHSRGAIIAAGNTTTRLLGTFQKVDYVFLIGTGGGVAHYTDYTKHIRLGDIVVSAPPQSQGKNYIYLYCEKMKNSPDNNQGQSSDKFNIKTWCPPNMELQAISQELWDHGIIDPNNRPWEMYIKEGMIALKDQEADFSRPPNETDKLFMSIGGKDMIEVNHPQVPEGFQDFRHPGMPAVHFGAIGSGRMLMKDDSARLEFANQHGLLAFDPEFDAVVESVFGNRKDNYIFIRGMADYKDGTKKKDWQPSAALAAAAFMKAVICAIETGEDD